jgi:mevalonate pyrophosphate decarboxylase
MDVLEQAEIDYVLNKINYIMQAMNADDQLTTLNETDLLLKIIPQKNDETKALSKEIHDILLNDDKMRILKLLREIKKDKDSGVEYYDTDRGSDPKLDYQKEFEQKMHNINDKIRSILAEVIREKIGETKI